MDSQLYTKWNTIETIPIKVKNKIGMPAFPLLFNLVFRFLTRAVRQEHKIKGILIRKEELKLSLLADDMILYLKDPENCTKNFKIINSFSKVAGYIVNMQKSVTFLYINNEHTEN
jgi:hypothetical protein